LLRSASADRVERSAGRYLGAILAALPGVTPMPRMVLSGVASEIVVQRTALAAIARGYAVFVAVDACGGVSARTEDVVVAGVILGAWIQMAEITLSSNDPEGTLRAGQAALIALVFGFKSEPS